MKKKLVPEKPGNKTREPDLQFYFKNPPMSFRPVPFWSWNDDLNMDELIRQIQEMKKQGLGGFFMHARLGLVTPYLSDDWMLRIRRCVEEADRLGMKAWLYDENNWPSGVAGGLVTKNKPEYYQHSLTYELIKLKDAAQAATDRNLIGLFTARQKGKTLTDFEPLSTLTETKLKERNPELVVFKTIAAGYQHVYTTVGYVDTLNPQATDRFIQVTHERYKDVVGKYFGNTVPGIFTDEPNFGEMKGVNQQIPMIPWTREFPAYFKERKGYDITQHLPSLFFPIGEYQKTRLDYWTVVTERFVESYTRKLFDWCGENQLKLTGHQLHEDRLVWQTFQGGACMPHYEFMQMPGMDHLCRDIANPMTAKQVTSAAVQLGKRRVLSETYGMSGSSLTFEQQKWIADWQFVLGVNFLNQHLASFTIRGHRKRDFPPTIHYQQPWYRYYRPVNDYFSRVSYILSQGYPVRKILVIHPVSSVWIDYDPHYNGILAGKENEIDNAFIKLTDDLLALQYDFDYGDEILMRKYGKIEGNQIRVGNAKYDLVLIPKTKTLSSNTYRIIKRFAESGGKVVVIDSLPDYIDGIKQNKKADDTFPKKNILVTKSDRKSLDVALSKCIERDIIIKDKKKKDISPILYQHRVIDNHHFYFLANTSLTDSFETTIQLEGKGKVNEWNPVTGDIQEISAKKSKNKLETELLFAPGGSYLIEIDTTAKPGKVKVTKRSKPKRKIQFKDNWKLKVHHPNCLVLDYAKYRLDKGVWQKEIPLWEIQQETQSHLLDKWINLEFEFKTEWIPTEESPCHLVLETPQRFQIEINGEWVGNADEGWWVDTSFRKINIAKFVKKGKNTIILTTKIEKDTELENIYIIGDFAIQAKGNKEFKIVNPKETAKTGNMVSQGYPFYAGQITLSQLISVNLRKNQKAILNLADTSTCVIRVLVNGKFIDQINWRPFEMDITQYLHKGKNSISISLVNTLKNLLGPHHQDNPDPPAVTPASFSCDYHQTDKYQFVSFGLLKSPIMMIY